MVYCLLLICFRQGIVPLGFCDIQNFAEPGHVHALQITGSELNVCCVNLHTLNIAPLNYACF